MLRIGILVILGILALALLTGTVLIQVHPADRENRHAAQTSKRDACVDCHRDVTPALVRDFKQGAMYEAGIQCSNCHGSEHMDADDVAEVQLPTPDTCATCHPQRAEQFKAGKHALAWTTMEAMPATHYQPMELIAGKKGCGGCHKIGLKSQQQMERLKDQGFQHGVASCDACHTRHAFSAEEARQPEACATCHMGFDHPQWEMWSNSKHGVRYQLKRAGVLPAGAAAPTCQTCHMHEGDHEVRTAWGFLAVRLPMPDDEQWKRDRTTILKALGVLDPNTNEPTARLDAVKAADLARLTEESWQAERQEMLKICSGCHAKGYARGELEKGDEIIRQADHLLAEAIRAVAGLYDQGILEKPAAYEHAYPDLLTFHEAETPIEQMLFKMFLEHRMRTFQGTFHANPDYAFWYGWAEMRSDLTEIEALAEEMGPASEER